MYPTLLHAVAQTGLDWNHAAEALRGVVRCLLETGHGRTAQEVPRVKNQNTGFGGARGANPSLRGSPVLGDVMSDEGFDFVRFSALLDPLAIWKSLPSWLPEAI